jgi:hypothetical protein
MLDLPTVKDLAAEVYAYGRDLASYDPADITEAGTDTPGGDFRLQVYCDGGWATHTGSADFDQDHQGHWGATFVPAGCTRADAKAIALDLLQQAEDFVDCDACDESEDE